MYKSVLLNMVLCFSSMGFVPLCLAMEESQKLKSLLTSHVVVLARYLGGSWTSSHDVVEALIPEDKSQSKELNFSLPPEESIVSLLPPEIVIKIGRYLVPTLQDKGEVNIVASLENLTHFACVNQTVYRTLYHDRYLYSRLKNFVTRDAQTLAQSCKQFREKYCAPEHTRKRVFLSTINKKKLSSDGKRVVLLPIFQEFVKEIYKLNAKNEQFKSLLSSGNLIRAKRYLSDGLEPKLVDFSDVQRFFLNKNFANEPEWLMYQVGKNLLRELIEKGLDPNTLFLNAEGAQCPLLYFAVNYFNGDEKLIELLLKHGANPELVI